MMQLSAKHPTMEMKNPVQRIGGGGIEQIPADWNQTDETAVDYIKNKPENLSDFNNDMGFLTQHQDISGKADKTALNTHTADTTAHITANERTYWNSKADYASVVEVIEDMNADINRKANTADLASVAFSGDYDDLTNCPIGVSSFTNDAGYLTAHQDISGKANTADLATVAFSGSYHDLSDKPSQEELPTYNVYYYRSISSMNMFKVEDPYSDDQKILEAIRSGNCRITRTFSLNYDPFDTLPAETTQFPEYEFIGVVSNFAFYRRVISFDVMNANPFLDVIRFTLGSTTVSSAVHNYVQLFDGIMTITDPWQNNPYPHAFTTFSSGGLFGINNVSAVKNQRVGWLSNFNFMLRISTHNDNVWLQPVETISANSVPRFIGESQKLGKRIVVSFDDFTDNANPTGTIDMTDLVDDTHINGLIDDKLPTPRVAKTASDTTATIDPNKLYVWPTMASLNISLNAGDSDIVNEYHFIFTSGTTATNLTSPQTVKKPYGFTVEANTTYEVSILENCMVVQRWEA